MPSRVSEFGSIRTPETEWSVADAINERRLAAAVFEDAVSEATAMPVPALHYTSPIGLRLVQQRNRPADSHAPLNSHESVLACLRRAVRPSAGVRSLHKGGKGLNVQME